MVHIIGGKKVAVNFYRFLIKNNIESKLYFFENELGGKISGAVPFNGNWKGMQQIGKVDKVIVSSETALNNLSTEDKEQFERHYFVREKSNIPSIAKEIGAKDIPFIPFEELSRRLPVIAKPKSSGSDVPFKFMIIKTAEELVPLNGLSGKCIFQEYFAPEEYDQMAIAGYFLHNESSLISVRQLNQYPVGISSHVRLNQDALSDLKKQIAAYLNKTGFKGFIEFEFKVNRKTGIPFLIDINPRLWGWSYFYFSRVKNIKEVMFKDAAPVLDVKAEWINIPRYLLSLSKLRMSMPKPKNFLSNNVSYEPLL